MRYAVLLLVSLLFLATPARADVRDHFLDAVNERRACATDLAPTGQRLLNKARAHSREMANEGFIFHSTAEELGDPRFSVIGEVVGVSGHWRYILEALFDSPPHRRILRDCMYQKIAVGIARVDGAVWLTGRVYAK